MSKFPIFEYYESVGYNRDVFLLNQADALWAYRQIHDNFDSIGRPLSLYRDVQGNSHVGLIPFVLLMQRQALAAFWALASHQSYQTWVLLRPGVEAALIIGKWVDDKANSDIWSRRKEDPDAYRKTYQGKKLVSRSLSCSAAIQAVLRRINDDFVHPNPEYYHRHTEVKDAGPDSVYMMLHYFDRDDVEHRANVLAFLHLLLVLQDALAELVGNLFPLETQPKIGLDVFEKQFQPTVDEFLRDNPDKGIVLTELGLWSPSQAA